MATESPPAPPPKPTALEKYNAALEKVAATPTPPEPPPKETPPVKPQDTPPKTEAAPAKSSPIDAAIEGTKPAERKEPDEISKTISELEAIEVPKGEHWKRARTTMRTQSQERQKLADELKSLKAQLEGIDPKLADNLTATTKERDGLKAEVEKLREAITAINVEYDPQYQEKFIAGREKLFNRASNRVKDAGGDVEKFNEAFGMPSGKKRTEALREALADADDFGKSRVMSVLDEIQDLDDQAADLRKNPSDAFEHYNANRREEQERRAADAERVKKSEFDKTVTALREKSPLLRPIDSGVEGGADYNNEIKEHIARAEKMFGPEAQFNELVEISVKGARYDWLEKLFLDQRKELLESKKRIADYEKSDPDFTGRAKGAPAAKDTRAPAEKYAKALAELQAGEQDEE